MARAKWLDEWTWKQMASEFFPGLATSTGIKASRDMLTTARERLRRAIEA